MCSNPSGVNDYKNQTIIEFCNVIDGGWSAFVPIQSLIDAYEMKDGLTIEEAQAKGEYNITTFIIMIQIKRKLFLLFCKANPTPLQHVKIKCCPSLGKRMQK